MLRATAPVALALVAAGLLVVPTQVDAAAPHSRSVLAGTGTSHLAASATSMDGPPVSQDLGEQTHDGNYPDSSATAISQGDNFTTYADTSQNAQLTATDVHIGGSSVGTLIGGTGRVTNTATVSFTPTDTARWEISMDGTSTSSGGGPTGCVDGAHLSFSGLATADYDVPCNTGLFLVQQTVTLVQGVTYTFAGGNPASSIDGSFTFAMEAKKVEPVRNTKPPTITGTAKVGKKLTSTKGTWSGSPTTFVFQWFRGTAKIAGAKKSTYTCVKADKGKKLKVVVTASKDGSSASATSKTTKAVTK